MNISAFDDYDREHPVLLKLVTHDNEVDLTAVDSHGDPHPKGTLLAVRPCGLYLYPGVSDEIGLPLDNEQRLKLYPQPDPDPEIIQLLKPLAEYMAVRDGNREWPRDADHYCPLNSCGGRNISVGQLRALAAYYERNK